MRRKSKAPPRALHVAGLKKPSFGNQSSSLELEELANLSRVPRTEVLSPRVKDPPGLVTQTLFDPVADMPGGTAAPQEVFQTGPIKDVLVTLDKPTVCQLVVVEVMVESALPPPLGVWETLTDHQDTRIELEHEAHLSCHPGGAARRIGHATFAVQLPKLRLTPMAMWLHELHHHLVGNCVLGEVGVRS